MTTDPISNYNFVNNQDEVSSVFNLNDSSVLTRMIVNASGLVQRFTWKNQQKVWTWSAPNSLPCDYYGHCGPNSNCDPNNSDKFECTCLPGFEPKYPQEWNLRNGKGGCTRKRGMSTCQRREWFEKVASVKVPDTSVTRVNMNLGLKACENTCLSDCFCIAYTSAYSEMNGGTGCLTYHGEMMDTRSYTNVGQDLYVRIAYESEYALDSIFSMKSDIFSFGVIVLDIISGKKNMGLFHDDPSSNLIQYRDDKTTEIVDSCIADSFKANEVLRCIQSLSLISSIHNNYTLNQQNLSIHTFIESEIMNPVKWSLYTLLVFHLFQVSTTIDTITANHSIRDGNVIVSGGRVFALGFFSPGYSVKRYLGIWYYQVLEQTIVWVANRDHPISGTSGVLAINSQGNLVLYEGNQSTAPVWSTNVSVTSMNNTVAQLLDSGNLVLAQNGAKTMLWQSFDHPTHTMLPFMKLGLDRRKGVDRFLTSWKSLDDPGTGNYSYRIDPSGFPQLSLYKGSVKWWRTGSWTGKKWTGVPEMTRNYIFNVTFVNNEDEVSIMYGVTDPSILTRMIVNESGIEQRFTWNNRENRWIGFWSAPKEQCDYYSHCGANSNCNPYRSGEFECTCLPGSEPKYPHEWYLRDGSGGCNWKHGMSPCQRGEGFVKLARVKVPDTSVTHVDMSLNLRECENKCLSNCSCIAYTSAYSESYSGIGCLTYHGDLLDTRTYTNTGQDLYVRVNAAELALYAKNGSLGKKDIVAIVICSFLAMLLLVAFVWDQWKEGKAIEIVDKSMGGSYSLHEVLRCIQIGLLCVQEQATDRPTMSSVVFMLGNDHPLPSPKQPAFITKRTHNNGDVTWNSSEGGSSINDVTISTFHGR
ncbi:hypothetical protein JRO89_XS06G0095400 [Xanthoceras sorbifolium]|uniref:Receptor-like serine/threonine-protein kinase n=1 Tax=Xanthoceras sorbifolium TaxID=99658 RepID=A0ABQ8HXG3_9ROSI|nr:hypothetical protein JRO89_XS06G0095400 [Xanthoceras sorbifolium]